jgi:DNA primase
MVNTDLLHLLEQVLGKGKKTSGNNYSFFSPFVSHYKPKLEINLESNSKNQNFWHCWVSNEKGGTIYALFKKLKVDKHHYESLNKIVKTKSLHNFNTPGGKRDEDLRLPPEFIKLIEFKSVTDISVSMQLKQAITYLKTRSILPTDIFRYNIGYCPTGAYGGRIIVPSYDENFNLNFFVSRTIFDDVNSKYKNPPVSKNIIGFDSFINWNEPITLVEGVFDAISARFNTIPLFGKIIQPLLKEKILIRKPPKVIVALDNDAIKDSIKICEWLTSNGIKTSMVKLPDKDINEFGFERFSQYISTIQSVDGFDLIKERILV